MRFRRERLSQEGLPHAQSKFWLCFRNREPAQAGEEWLMHGQTSSPVQVWVCTAAAGLMVSLAVWIQHGPRSRCNKWVQGTDIKGGYKEL